MKSIYIIIALALFPLMLKAQIITTFAGNGVLGGTGDGGAATSAEIGDPNNCAFDANSNFYFTTVGNEKVRMVSQSGIISTIAGTGVGGYNGDGIAATAAKINTAGGIAVDKLNNIYIADAQNNRIRRIDATTGIITTIAGNGTSGFSGDRGPATAAILYNPVNICFDNSGNLLVSDINNQRIREIDTFGIIKTIAGSGIYGYSGDGGQATNAALRLVTGLCVDKIGNIYITQLNDYVVRKIDTAGIITTIAGNGIASNTGDGGMAKVASLTVINIASDNSGNLFISGYGGNVIRKIDSFGIINTIVGTSVAGFNGDGGPATAAEINSTNGIVIDACGNLYIADKANVRIRKVAFNPNCWPESVETVTTNNIKIYPNPTTDVLHIDGITQSGQQYKIISVVGKVLQQGTLKPGSNSIDIKTLADGVYMVEMSGGDEVKKVVKMIKQ